MMKFRFVNNHNVCGRTGKFNIHSMSEVLVNIYKPDYDMDSVYQSDIEVMIYGIWINLTLAFRNHDVITDNYNSEFFIPLNWCDRKRGYTLY